MKIFESNLLLKSYYKKQITNAKKMIFIMGPLGALLLFYWLYNIFGFTRNFAIAIIGTYTAHITYVIYGPLFTYAIFMNRLVHKCELNENGWTFNTLRWFLSEKKIVHATIIVDVVKLESSFFNNVGDVYKLNLLTGRNTSYVYIIAKAFDEFDVLADMLRSDFSGNNLLEPVKIYG